MFLGRRTGILHLGIYVEDGFVSAESEQDIEWIMKELSHVFTLSRCVFGLFLGMELRNIERLITLSQRFHSERIIARYRMDTAHLLSTPCSVDDPGSVISSHSNFAVMTRPDILYAVSIASGVLDDYTDVQVVRYLKGTTIMRLLLAKEKAASCVDKATLIM